MLARISLGIFVVAIAIMSFGPAILFDRPPRLDREDDVTADEILGRVDGLRVVGREPDGRIYLAIGGWDSERRNHLFYAQEKLPCWDGVLVLIPRQGVVEQTVSWDDFPDNMLRTPGLIIFGDAALVQKIH